MAGKSWVSTMHEIQVSLQMVTSQIWIQDGSTCISSRGPWAPMFLLLLQIHMHCSTSFFPCQICVVAV